MGIDRIEHFMGGDALAPERGAYASLENLDVTRPEVDAIIQLYDWWKGNTRFAATDSRD